MRRPRVAIGSIAVIALLSAACAGPPVEPGSAPSGSTPEQASPPDGPAPTGPVGETLEEGTGPVPEILRFDGPLVGGGTLEGAEFAGAPVAVWFWAPW